MRSRGICNAAKIRRRPAHAGQPLALCRVWNPFRQQAATALKALGSSSFDLSRCSITYRTSFRSWWTCSKTAWGSAPMPFRLRHDLGDDFLLVHLVRDPRGVCWSTIRTLRRRKAGGRELGRCLRTIFGWMFANLACEAFGLMHPKRYLRLRYEDVIGAPQDVLAPVFGKVALSPSSLESLAKYDNRHQLHGNRMRFKLMSVTDLKQDLAWKSKMSRPFRWLILVLSWPLIARYAYPRSSCALT